MAASLPQQSLVDAALSMPPTYSNKRKAVMGPSFTLPTSQSSQASMLALLASMLNVISVSVV